MKTPQELAEEYAEKWNEGEPGDPDVAYTSFLAGYSVAMEQQIELMSDLKRYIQLRENKGESMSPKAYWDKISNLEQRLQKHLSSFTEREQPKD